MDDDQQIPEMVWDDMARAADLADDLARQGRAVRFGRGHRSCGVCAPVTSPTSRRSRRSSA